MSNQPKTEDVSPQAGDGQQEGSHLAAGWGHKIEEQFKKIKEHGETYPYVWASYTLVYGGFGLWLKYRWKRLRQTEDRIRGLQGRLKKIVAAEESTQRVAAAVQSPNSASLAKANKLPTSANKATK